MLETSTKESKMNPIRLFVYLISWIFQMWEDLDWELSQDYVDITKSKLIRWEKEHVRY